MAATPIGFEPINELERLLLAAARDEPGAVSAFQHALLTHDLYAATPRPMPHGALGPNDKVELILYDLPKGGRATAVFTSAERLAASYPDGGYVGAPGAALLNMVRANPVVLNPGHPHAIVWSAEAVATLAGRNGRAAT